MIETPRTPSPFTWRAAGALFLAACTLAPRPSLHAQALAPAAAAPTAVVEPAALPAYAQAVMRVRVTPRRALPAGTVVTTQLPSAMLAALQSYSLTKTLSVRDPQIVMPAAMPTTPAAAAALASTGNFQQFTKWDTVTVEVAGRDEVLFDIKIEKREFELGTTASSRHGQAVHATAKVDLPATVEIVFTYRTSTPWVAAAAYPVYVAIDGARLRPDPTFAVVAGPAVTHRVIVPSSARPGVPFPVRVVSLDRFDNLATSEVKNVTLAEGARVVKSGISYTGHYETTASLSAPGIHRLTLNGVTSNPIRITATSTGPYWGDLHNHSEADHDAAAGGVSTGYARDVSLLDFHSMSNHMNGAGPEYLARAQRVCREYEVPGRFVTFLGFETSIGTYHTVATFDDCSVSVPLEVLSSGRTPIDAAKQTVGGFLAGKRHVTSVHHSGVIWAVNDFSVNTEFFASTRLFEIYSSHGESELYDPASPLAYEQQVSAPFSLSRKGPNYARDAWALGQRMTTVASSDDHNGQPGKRHNGLTAVVAPALDRGSLLTALESGASYATTGERLLLDATVNGQRMGTTLTAAKGQPLAFRIEVHGTGPLDRIDVFRFVKDGTGTWETAWSQAAIGREDITATFTEPSPGPAIYYVRVWQQTTTDVYVPVYQQRPVAAWSSPIWIE